MTRVSTLRLQQRKAAKPQVPKNGGFLYKNRTVAEMDMECGFLIGSKLEIPFSKRYTEALFREGDDTGADGLKIKASLPSAPCPHCGARGWCGHNGRVQP